MTKKDLPITENIDRNKKANEDWDSHHTTEDRYPKEAKGIAETEVKNAHASGDGSVGRNDTGLFEGDEKDKENQGEQPSY